VGSVAEGHDPIRVARHGPVVELVLDRPGARNALGVGDREVLRAAYAEAAAAPEVRAVVLTGAGPVFSAGGDIAGMHTDPASLEERFRDLAGLVTTLSRGRLPIVAAVEGGAYGLGLGLAALADLVVAGRSARFAASFGKLGLTADTGASWSLTRRIGWARTRRLLLTTETVDADRALEWGMVDHLVDDGTARDRALELAAELAERSPHAVAASRRLMADLPDDLDDALAAEGAAQAVLMARPEFATTRDAFLDGRRATAGSTR